MRKLWVVVCVALAVGLLAVPAGAAGSTYTNTITVKSSKPATWAKAAKADAKAGCNAGGYTTAKITIRHGSAKKAYGFECEVIAPTTTTKPHVPVPTDFTIGIDITSKQCFGSAGCNLQYRINVTYNALTPLDPTKTYTVVYDVTGGNSPLTANFKITGTQISFQPGFTQTPNDGATLTATATSVFEGG